MAKTWRWRSGGVALLILMPLLGLFAPSPAATAAPIAPPAAVAVPRPAMIAVPTYSQQRNLSCEYASLVIAMGAFDTWVSEWDLDGIVGWSENPHWGFRGDINGVWGNTDDYGVYAGALVPALNAYGFWGDEFYAQGDSSALTSRLDAGNPTLVWIGMWGDTGFYEYTADGTRYKLLPGLHVVVAYGYDDAGVYVSDPATGGSRFFDWGTFMWMWNAMDGMGLAVGPM